MLLILFFVVIAAGCVVLDWKSLKGRAGRRDLAVYGALWIAGMAATICTILKIQVPSPLLIIMFIYKPFNDAVQFFT